MPAPMVPVKNHPGVYKRGGTWVVKYTYRSKQYKPSFPTLAQAKAFKAKLTLGDVQPETNQRFDQYAEQWMAGYRGDEGTRANYARSLQQQSIPFFGRFRIKDIKSTDIRRFVRELEDKKVNPPSIQRHLKPLRALLSTAYEEGDIARNPAVGLKLRLRPTLDDLGDGKAKAMSEQQACAIIEALPQQHQLFFSFLLQTGLRISEALGLRWSDVDLQQRYVHVQRQRYQGRIKKPKTRNAVRKLPLSQGMVAGLRQHRMVLGRPPDDAPLWCSALHGSASTRYEPLSDHNLRRVLRPVASGLGLPWVTLHTFRHTCATMLLHKGKNIVQVCRWLGHSRPSYTLDTYVHLMNDDLGGADLWDQQQAV